MRILTSAAVYLLVASAMTAVIAQNPSAGFTGRWNLTGTGSDADRVYWLEIKDEGGTLKGMFLNRGGSPVPLAVVKIENGELLFRTGNARGEPTGPEFRAKLQGGKLVGQHIERTGAGREGAPPPTERTVSWVGVRPPVWPESNANGQHTYGKPVALFDGKTLDAWDVQRKNQPMKWTIEEGVMTNEPPGANNLVSKEKFKDFKIHAEYKLAPDGNSGIYLRGRYELQVLDDFGKPTESHSHMSIYAWSPPLVNASKPAGEWQTMEAVLVNNRVTVTLNGQKVQDNAAIQAITGGALDADETAPGPIVLQGDHQKVWYRNVVVTPITKAGK